MKSYQIFIGIVCTWIGFSSCERTFSTVVDFNVPHTPMIALKCGVNNYYDSTYVTVTGTKRVTDTGICPFLNNAQLRMLENGVEVGQFQYDTAIRKHYSLFHGYIPGRKYQLIVNHNGYKEVTAEEMMPSKPNNFQMKVQHYARKMNTGTGSSAQWYDEVTVSFDDDPSTANYYAIDGAPYYQGFPDDQEFFWSSTEKFSVDPDLDAEITTDPLSSSQNVFYQKIYFNDRNFNGKRKTVTYFIPTGNAGDPVPNPQDVYVLFEHLTESAYRYERSYQLYRENDGNPFSEPIKVHSNVNNGVGIFKMKHRTIDSL
jgi:hypothetical protein